MPPPGGAGRGGSASSTTTLSRSLDRHRGTSPARRDRRLGPGRLLHGRAHPQARGNARRGRHVRPAADALWAGALRRRAGPSQDQVGDPRLREDRGAPRVPLLRQRRGRHRRLGGRAPGALPRGRLRLRHGTDRHLGHPRRGPARQPSRHRVRQLVQRPPRFRRPRVRPLLRARRRDRQRQRRRRRRPDARPDRRRSWRETDTADHAIEAFNGAAVKEILVLGRRGPAQAAFTNPEVRELGEMVDADIDVDAGEMELDDLSREWLDSDDADPTNRRNVEHLHRLLAARAGGKEQEDRDALPPLSGRDPGRRQGGADRGRPQRAAARRLGAASRGRHRRARDDRLRPGAALDRLQGDPDRGHAIRRAAAA